MINKVYSNIDVLDVILFNKVELDRDMSVGFINPRVTAIFNVSVVVKVIKKDYARVLNYVTIGKEIKHHLGFAYE